MVEDKKWPYVLPSEHPTPDARRPTPCFTEQFLEKKGVGRLESFEIKNCLLPTHFATV